MARFSQNLIAGLTNPAFGGNLTALGQQAGSAQAVGKLSRQLAGLDLSTSGGLMDLAGLYSERGQAEQALKAQALAQDLAASERAAQNREGLRASLLSRASAIPEAKGMITSLPFMDASQLAQMSQSLGAAETAIAERTRQAKALAPRVDAVNRFFTDSNQQPVITSELTSSLARDPEALADIVGRYETEIASQRLDNVANNAQKVTQARLAQSRGAPVEVLAEINQGMYVGDNKSLLDKLDGTGTQLKSFTFLSGPRQGQFASFPELNGKVLTPNPDGTKSWKLPDEVGLLEVSKGEWSTEGPPKLSTASARVIPALASAAGNTQALINELDNLGALRTGVVLAKISPVVLDETATLEQFNLSVTEALSRLQSGAAIKDDELPRFQRQFEIQPRDLFAPQHMMQKIVQAAALTRVGADLFAENITPQKAIELIQESAAITFTEEEIARMEKGEAKRVLREKTDKYLSAGQPKTLSLLDEIRRRNNI
jgi:DNA-binding transcriptional regulator YbjK